MARIIFLCGALLLGGCAASPKPQIHAVTTVDRAVPQGTGDSAGAMRGKASWYGAKFQGKPTASGEKFDKDAMTAAHKTLKFQTKLRVTNTDNNKSVIVRVNDRMPDVPGNKGRVIDLSEGAFEKIAEKDAGLVPVELEIVK
ncbi:hypothetical protein BH09SUM1_BH09SUM1_00010 [soil metagenome]